MTITESFLFRCCVFEPMILAEVESALAIERVLNRPWPLPIWLTILLALIVAAALAGLYGSERGDARKFTRVILALTRFILLALVLWMLAGWNWLRFKSDKPELIIAIDRSASMQTRDFAVSGTSQDGLLNSSQPSSSEQPSRFESTVSLLKSFPAATWKSLDDRYQIRWVTVADQVQNLDSSADMSQTFDTIRADATQSRLGESLAALLQQQVGRPTTAIILLTDGITTGGLSLPDAAAKARSMAVPVYTVAMGQELAQPDIRLADLLVDEAVFLGDEVNLQFTLSGTDIDRATIEVRLNDVASGEVLDSSKMDLSRQGNQHQARLRFVPHRTGEIALSISASQVAGETNIENNVIERSITVRDQSIRVLMVHQTPNFELRFLKNLLERVRQPGDKGARAFELDYVLQDADAAFVDQDESAIRLVPSDRDRLSTYDVVVLGDFDPSLISRGTQSAISEHVSMRGGGLILVCARDYSPVLLQGAPMAAILPVEFARQNQTQYAELRQLRWQPTVIGQSALPLQLTPESEQNAKLWQALPGPEWVQAFSSIKPAAQVLAVAQPANSTSSSTGEPLLVSHFAGAGRVIVQASDETYRWSSFAGNDLFHQRYWIQMLRWLSRGRLSQSGESTLATEPRRVNLGEPLRLVARLKTSDALAAGGECRVTIERADGVRTELTLPRVAGAANVFQLTKSDFLAGSHRVLLSHPVLDDPPSTSFNVTAPPGEQANLRSDWAGLRAVADKSRGKFYLPEDTRNLFEELPPGTTVRMGSLPPEPLWNHPLVATAFFTLIAFEWLLRRRCRML